MKVSFQEVLGRRFRDSPHQSEESGCFGRSRIMAPQQQIPEDSSLGVKSSLELVSRSDSGRMREKETGFMDAITWSGLPAELMEMVLARLPIQSVIRFRNVCVSWNRLLSSRAFLNEYYQAQLAQQETWFLSGTVAENKLAIYAPSLNKWHIATLPSINMVNFDDVVVPEATMGGLVCLTKYSRQEQWTTVTAELFVWNPLTNDCRRLPDTTRNCSWPGPCVAGMHVNCATNEYKVVTVRNHYGQVLPAGNTDAVVTEIYYSSTNAWSVCESIFPHQTVSRLTRRNVFCTGSVYSVTRKPYTIVAFELTKEVWREIEVPIEDVECPNLVELYNRLYMVAGISRDESIRIWRLIEHTRGRVQWIEVDRMPPELLKVLATTQTRPSMRHWRCVGSGDSLFFRGWGSQEVLMYNISRQSWSWLPACDLDKNRYYYAWNGLASNPGWMSP